MSRTLFTLALLCLPGIGPAAQESPSPAEPVVAQQFQRQAPGQQRFGGGRFGQGQFNGRGPGGRFGDKQGMRPIPRPVVFAALDPNGDGILSAQEIERASAALLTLDKNGDGQLTPQELVPGRHGDASGRRGAKEGRKPPRSEPTEETPNDA